MLIYVQSAKGKVYKKREKLIKISFRYVRVAENFEKICFFFFFPIFPLFFPRHIGKNRGKKLVLPIIFCPDVAFSNILPQFCNNFLTKVKSS